MCDHSEKEARKQSGATRRRRATVARALDDEAARAGRARSQRSARLARDRRWLPGRGRCEVVKDMTSRSIATPIQLTRKRAPLREPPARERAFALH